MLLFTGFYIPVFFVYPTPQKEYQVPKLLIKIKPLFNGLQLKLNDVYYTNLMGDSFIVKEFKFYISSLTFRKENNVKYVEPNSVHLFDAEDSSTWSFYIPAIENGNYKFIDMCIGLDSVTTTAGILDGDLDPSKGMYWAWNTGYTAAKLVGQSFRCNTLHHLFEFHIGGYLSPYNSLRKVTLLLSGMQVNNYKQNTIEMEVDINAWFNTPLTIDLTKTNSILLPGKEAMMMADNYADMLSISVIK
ncbi:MAG: hypothetical protein H7296_05330 [Bacteroidia bacterium]|nr:hypothetical protein [Bacteroidia bacterium]